MADPFPSFGLANYRSFDLEGAYFEPIRKFNIIIGRNNCGKSNVLRFLAHTSRTRQAEEPLFNSVTDTFLSDTTPPLLCRRWLIEELVPHERHNLIPWKYFSKSSQVEVKAAISNGSLYSLSITDAVEDAHTLAKLRRAVFDKNWSELPDLEKVRQVLGHELANRAVQQFRSCTSSLIYVPDIRQLHVDAESPGDPRRLNGRNVVAMLHEMQHPETGNDHQLETFAKVERFVRDLLGSDGLRLEVSHDKRHILISMHGKRLPLESFGTGIHELVILCSAFAIHQNHVVCIEEPELHFHPELQRRLIRFLDDETNNTYFITTHSNVFIELNARTTLAHVEHDGRSSQLSIVSNAPRIRHVVADLGCRASDLLQSNCVIWVEGPSDRIIINRWLHLWAPDLIEGAHYSIMFYGGSGLAYVTAAEETTDSDFIDLLRINKHCIVIMDRDGEGPKPALAARKRRVRDELGDDRCWITKGREIENYIPESLWLQLIQKGRQSEVTGFSFGKDDQLQEAIRRASHGKRSLLDYAGNKPARAREVMALVGPEHLDMLDLKKRLTSMVGLICDWNGRGVAAVAKPAGPAG